ncbi:hypothetical protein JCM1840_004290 [Sporobolomyces johnsonii]
MSAIYSIFTSPNHPPVPDHLPTLIVTPNGRPTQILYTYLHTNLNTENYLLTPSDAGDLCVAKLFPPDRAGGASRSGASSSHSHSSGGSANHVRCEASRNLRWTIQQAGIANPIYKLTLPNPDAPDQDQPLFQVSKPNPSATWWTLFYFTYAGHLIPPKRVEFGRIQKNPPEAGGGTRVAITGKSDEEKAVWKTLGEGNEDMVEWIVICAALVVLDDEIIGAAERAGGAKIRSAGGQASPMPMQMPPRSPHRQRTAPPMQGGPAPNGHLMPQRMEPPRSASTPIPVPQAGAFYTPPPPHPVHAPPPQGSIQPPNGYPPQGHGPDPRLGPAQQQQQQPYGHAPSPAQYPIHSSPQQQDQPLPFPGQQPPPSASRAPSSYRPGSRPGHPGSPPQGQAPPMPFPGSPVDQGTMGAAVAAGPPGGGGGSSAARMVQEQVQQKRLQKARH